MPYRRGTRRRVYGRRRHVGGKLTKRQKYQVKSLISKNVEIKYFDYGFGATTYTSSPSFANFSLIPQGGSDAQRVGDMVTLKNIDCRFQVVGGDVYNTFRVILFRWYSPSATAPTASDLFDSVGSGAEYVLCPTPALEKNQQVHIIFDKVWTLPQTYAATSAGALGAGVQNTSRSVQTLHRKFYGRRLGRKNIRFNPAATSSPSGSLWICGVSDSAITPNPTLYFNVRVSYTDA